MNTLLVLAVSAATTTSNEDVPVRPGWTPLLIVLAMGAFVVFLFFSMRKQLRRINVPGDPQGTPEGTDVTPEKDTPPTA